ncbi:MAG: hypothetical protein CFK49_07410 [Armatimonadetes bacterium JP3_11]|nr:MAG: hypothetical protein CFK49_07410 [Armatimonadetes bacterium JP3_11]
MARWKVRNLLWRLGQLLLWLLPLTLMTLAGAMYLWQVKLALEDALPPALRDYARRQAQLDVRVERIVLSLQGALLTNTEISTLTGDRLFRARYIEARLPREQEPLTIEIDRPEVWLQRNRRGVWNIDPLLKQPRPPEPTPITIRVRAREGTLYFDDFLPDTPVRATLWAQEFTLSQPRIGQYITLRGVSDALGTVEADALSDGTRWLVDLQADHVRGDAFKSYLPKTDLDVQQLHGRVAFQIVYEPNKPLQLHGVAKGVAQSASFRQKVIPYREFEWQAAFTEKGLSGELKTRDQRLHAYGIADWSGTKPFFAAQAGITGNDATTLWRLVREDESPVQGRYTIQARLEGTPDSLQVIGITQLERVRTPQGDLNHLRAEGLFKDGQLLLPTLEAQYAGRTVHGKLWLDTKPKTPELRLYATVRDLPVQRVPALREQELQGAVDAQIVAHGKLDNPRIEANLLTDALFYKQRRLGGARARIEYANGTLRLPLALLQGAAGLVQVSGEILNLLSENPRFDLQVNANELDLNLLAQLGGYSEGELLNDGEGNALRLEGVGYLTAQIRGSLKSPEAVAEAVVFDGRLGDIGAEITVADLNLLERELRITQLQILRRASQLSASGVVNLPDRSGEPPRFQLQGNLFEFDLASIPDWLRREFPLLGLASGVFEAEGNPQKFAVRATLNSDGIQYDQTLLRDSQVQVVAQFENGLTQVAIRHAQARLGEGLLTAHGQWHPKNNFEAYVRLENASLELLAPYLPPEYRLTGQASLEATASGTLEAPRVSVKVASQQTTLNGTLIGDVEGVAEFGSPTQPRSPYEGVTEQGGEHLSKTLYARLTLRTPDGEARMTQLRYDAERETLQLDAETDPLPIDWLRRVVRAVPDALPPAVAERIETLQGRVQATLSVSGSISEPIARLTLNGESLEWRGQSLGDFALQGVWQGKSELADLAEALPAERAAEAFRRLRTQSIELQRLRWQAENTRLEARGTYTPQRLDADFEIAQLPLRWARLWEPSLPAFDGNLDLSLIAAGNPESPELTLSATVNRFTYDKYTIDQILFSQIDVREGAIQTEDALIRVGDYQARLSGRLPFHWSPLRVPNDEPMQIQARLREQPLTVLGLFAPIDHERTQGVIEASLEVNGTLSEPQPRGRLTITNGAIAVQDLRTALQEIGLQVEFDGRDARIVQARARSSEGGRLQVEGAVDLSSDRPTVNARIVAESFTAHEPKLPVLEGSAKAVISGTVQVDGNLAEPTLRGTLRVLHGFVYLPPEFAPRESGEPLPVNPRFDLRIEVVDGFTLRNPNLDARLEGNVQVGGSLQSPTLTGEFNLRGGALSLPTARLRIEPDSIARVNYPFASPTGETIARVELDVRASTSVVAPDFTGDPIRYRIEVDVRGPLDDPERLQLTARSDPLGLSEQRILSLLGRGQALAAIARGADPAQVFREQISDIFTAQLLPGLLAPLESGIAEALDLEQFSLDYSGLRPASFYLVKNLFDGVGIAYRRSIGVGDQEYQVRLFYRLPFRNRLLQRLRVGVGFDHKQNRFVFIEGSVLFR